MKTISQASKLKTLTQILCSVSAIATASRAQAGVDIIRGSFSTTFIDYQEKDLSLTRRYDSRSLHNGLFGFGWCSNLEDRLDITDSKQIVYHECDRTFRLRRESNDQWRASSGAKLTRLGDFYQFSKGDGVERSFDLNGRLQAWRMKGSREISLVYDPNGLLRAVKNGEGTQIRFTRDANLKHIESISTDQKTLASFRYQIHRLISVTNAWKNTFTYSYDSTENLTQIDFPDGTSQKIGYSIEDDVVHVVRGRNGCSETYSFTPKKPHSLLVRSQKTCFDSPERKQVDIVIDFRKDRDSNGRHIASIKRSENQ